MWDGIRGYEAEYHDYLQGQIGNPNGPDKPNKKQYDPRVWLRAGEESFVERLKQAFAELNNVGTLASADRRHLPLAAGASARRTAPRSRCAAWG